MTEPLKAALIPSGVQFACPHCGAVHGPDVDMIEDNSGLHTVKTEERYLHCPYCLGFIDIGWSGWRWLEPHNVETD